MKHFIRLIVLLLLNTSAYSSTLSGTIYDADGAPVTEVVITAHPIKAEPSQIPIQKKAKILDQVNREFISHVLVVRVGESVIFPNNDSTLHHVYSFSATKPFELELYKGIPANSIIFDKTGVVVLGCNVHDWMVGYIYVTDTPYFAISDKSGHWSIELPANDYKVTLWRDDLEMIDGSSSKDIKVVDGNNVNNNTVKLNFHRYTGKPPPLLEQGYLGEP